MAIPIESVQLQLGRESIYIEIRKANGRGLRRGWLHEQTPVTVEGGLRIKGSVVSHACPRCPGFAPFEASSGYGAVG